MSTWEIISFVLNILFIGGGLVTLFTLRSKRRLAQAEAKAAEIDNDEKASLVMREYIVKPLKTEINALRKDVRNLQKAIAKVSDCPYADSCPVKHELQNNQDFSRQDNERADRNSLTNEPDNEDYTRGADSIEN